MIVYREQRRAIGTDEALRRIRQASGFELQMEIGEFESGVADALCPELDTDCATLRSLREWTLAPSQNPPFLPALPERITVSVPEGFAYYALDPELYRMAARRFLRERGRRGRVAVIGIRSIGSTLSSIVEAELRAGRCETQSWTVRPRGHPWDRVLRVSDALERLWREWEGVFAIVDEGPGLSGSSFASVAEYLSGLGIDDSRIVYFPSWDADASALVSAKARDRWLKHSKYLADFEELGLFEDAEDLSAGKWRARCRIWPAVQPQHERRKYLRSSRLYKFAGYGRYGRRKLDRAGRLEGFVPQPDGSVRGFLDMPWVEGHPAALSCDLIRHVALYLAQVRLEFSLETAPEFDGLCELLSVNTPAAPDPSRWRHAVNGGVAVALDGRMLPHEWIETSSGFSKMDALEHHDDHFYPGPQDIAWDLAAFALEYELDRAGQQLLVETYARASNDFDAPARLPFYRLAYLAFRLGYADMAGASLGETEDGARFRLLRDRYGRQLAKEIAGGG